MRDNIYVSKYEESRNSENEKYLHEGFKISNPAKFYKNQVMFLGSTRRSKMLAKGKFSVGKVDT